MTQTLNVEYDELMARADELEQPLPAPPSANPQAPCALSFVLDGATQLGLSADSIRQYLKYGEREFGRLAKSLRNAAKAYEEVDAAAAESIATSFSGSAATAGSAGGDGLMNINCDPDEDYVPVPPPPPPPPPVFEYPYYEVRQAATDIESVDQGTAFTAFASEWDSYQRKLQETTRCFRPFEHWEGSSARLVELNFESHRSWIYSMVSLCSQISAQAKTIVSVHKWAVLEHPTAYEVALCDYWYKYYKQTQSPYLYQAIEWYAKLQAKSEEVLPQYQSRANLPLAPANPKSPTPALQIDAPPAKPDPSDPGPPGSDPGSPDDPGTPDDVIVDPDNPTDGLPSEDGYLPDPTGMTMPSAGAGTPTMPSTPDNAKLTNALTQALKGGPAGAGMKPASLGGAGVPSMPLQPSADADATARPAAAGPGAGSLGKGVPGVGGTGGGMGGMAPMGGAGQGQNQGKGKRTPQDDDALYTEDRAWTEGVIGRRRAKDAPDQ